MQAAGTEFARHLRRPNGRMEFVGGKRRQGAAALDQVARNLFLAPAHAPPRVQNDVFPLRRLPQGAEKGGIGLGRVLDNQNMAARIFAKPVQPRQRRCKLPDQVYRKTVSGRRIAKILHHIAAKARRETDDGDFPRLGSV